MKPKKQKMGSYEHTILLIEETEDVFKQDIELLSPHGLAVHHERNRAKDKLKTLQDAKKIIEDTWIIK